MADLNKQVILITGANRGQGKGFCEEFLMKYHTKGATIYKNLMA
ncbi:hypothetical protein [Halobacillus shinanisalinarum]|nr:hypothetical protein [Halobacillus shinanisalinarum]